MSCRATRFNFMYELYFRQRVERGLAEMRKGETLSHDEVRKSVARWLKTK